MVDAKPVNPSDSEQPALFPPELLADVPALETAALEFAHTGKIVSKDHGRCELILTHYLQTGSLRATAMHLGCSTRTIHRILEVFERNGKLAALKERLSHRLGLILELSADDMAEKAVRGELKLSPIDYAVLLDKKLLLDGEATQRIEERVQVDVRLSDVTAYLASKGMAAPAIDVESTVSSQDTVQFDPCSPL